jgi:hypothetical protein
MAHCTSPTAATIKLTDAIHQSFNAKLAQALTIHRDLTAQAKAGGTPDVTQLAALITQIVADLTKLQQTPDVQTLTATVQKGATIK